MHSASATKKQKSIIVGMYSNDREERVRLTLVGKGTFTDQKKMTGDLGLKPAPPVLVDQGVMEKKITDISWTSGFRVDGPFKKGKDRITESGHVLPASEIKQIPGMVYGKGHISVFASSAELDGKAIIPNLRLTSVSTNLAHGGNYGKMDLITRMPVDVDRETRHTLSESKKRWFYGSSGPIVRGTVGEFTRAFYGDYPTSSELAIWGVSPDVIEKMVKVQMTGIDERKLVAHLTVRGEAILEKPRLSIRDCNNAAEYFSRAADIETNPDIANQLRERVHTVFMRLAIQESYVGAIEKRHGGPFGAVVVVDNKVVSVGHNQVVKNNDPSGHAENVAIRGAGKKLGSFDLSNATLYTSCEPCPMCLGLTVWAKIGTVYTAANAEDAAAIGFRDRAIYTMFRKGPTVDTSTKTVYSVDTDDGEKHELVMPKIERPKAVDVMQRYYKGNHTQY